MQPKTTYTKIDLDNIFKRIVEEFPRKGVTRYKLWMIADGKSLSSSNKLSRPKSAYLFFLDDFRKKQTPDIQKDITMCAKLGGAAWQALDEAGRAPYVERANEAKKIHSDKSTATTTTTTTTVADSAESAPTPTSNASPEENVTLESKKTETTANANATVTETTTPTTTKHSDVQPIKNRRLVNKRRRQATQDPGVSTSVTA